MEEADDPTKPTHHHHNQLELAQEANEVGEEDTPDEAPSTMQDNSKPHNLQIKILPQPPRLSPSTTPEPSSMTSSSTITSGGSSLFNWYSSNTTPSMEQESKSYRNYVQNIDKCLKQFEYSTEWPDLIAALTKLNKVISTYNSTLSTQSVTTTSPPPLPRTHLITKRLSQCLHPNLPSGVHLKTLETFELIFQGFKYHDYIQLESELFSFVSGLLPLWSYAAISVKPKLLTLYENHLVRLGQRLKPALEGIMLSLFCGLVDDGVEQDIKIRTTNLLTQLSSSHPQAYKLTLNNLIESHTHIHLPVITHVMQTNYLPPPTTLLHLVTSPNTLVQRNALELLNRSYSLLDLPHQVQVRITRSAIQTLLKRDPSITRRVFTFIEQNHKLLVSAIECLINECEDGQAFTRILSTILDNPKLSDIILPQILAPVVKYLMKCEYNTSLSFLSTLNSQMLSTFFIDYLFQHSTLDDLESRVIVFNYVVKLRLFEIDYNDLFNRLSTLQDTHIRVILHCVRLHYSSHHDSFIKFCNAYMSNYFDLQNYELLQLNNNDSLDLKKTHNPSPPTLQLDFVSHSLEFVLELLQRSTPDEVASKYVVLGACTASTYTRACVTTYIHFQDMLAPMLQHTHALHLIFQHCHQHKQLLDHLKYPEKYLLSEMQNDDQIRNVIELDLNSSPLVVLKLVDPTTMGTPYRRFLCEQFISSNSNLIMSSILKYLEFSVDKQVVKAKSMSDLLNSDEDEDSNVKHAQSVYMDQDNDQHHTPHQLDDGSCAYDSARVHTLVDKLEFVVEVNREFLLNVDLVVLLSKLVLLATIHNNQQPDPNVTLSIQTKSLRLIEKIARLHGESTHSFVYDSILNYLSNVSVISEYSLLWELEGVNVLNEFFPLDIENYTLALVVQKRLNARATDNSRLNELCERVHLRWLHAIGNNLAHLNHHYNALVLITYTTVCRNLLDHSGSEHYSRQAVAYISGLLKHVLGGSVGGTVPVTSSSSNTGFLSSLFGSSSIKEQSVDEHEALRIALLGKLDLLVRIACKRTRVIAGLLDLLKYLYETAESQMLSSVNKCLDDESCCSNLDLVLKDLKVPASKLCSSCDKIVDHPQFLCKYLKYERTLDVGSVVTLCKSMNSCHNSLTLVNEYLKHTGSKATREVQELVTKSIDMGVEKREFTVLEVFVPAIFDLVWGDNEADNGSSLTSAGGSGASNANARDQKIIVNVVHGVVVAVLVHVKAGSTSSYTPSCDNNSVLLLSALRVLEQVSHHTYLRKAWKKEVFELITNEPTFFYFTPECLGSWKVIVDNLFTQDRSTFSELITRLTQTTQMSTSALNIFGSKESEVYETRASLLKRLAFVLHSSERDQYAKYITNIQEKIAEALKLGATGGGSSNNNTTTTSTTTNPAGGTSISSSGSSAMVVPVAVNQSVFLCFRIMVSKFNCNVLVSLWPIIVHEIVTVLNSLHQHVVNAVNITQLALSQQEQQQDSTLTPPQVDPPYPHLQMYLQTLKLLNYLLTLSSDSQLPHFQLYKWAFTEHSTLQSLPPTSTTESNNNNHAFIPYIQKLRTAALTLYPSLQFNTPPLRIKSVSSLEELASAFGCLDQHVSEHEWEVIDFCDAVIVECDSSDL